MMIDLPRIMVAGVSSGVGKTSVALALVHAFKRRGLVVQTFKVGPDFLDPTYLSRVSGRHCYNIDGWMMGKDYVTHLVTEKSADADMAVIEGVMGLFDGSGPASSDGSSAQIAKWLDCPILLVADAGGLSRSFAALVTGYSRFETGINVAGVIANRCGSKNHVTLLSRALEAADAPPLFGGIEKSALPTLPRRHLGLVTANNKVLDTKTLDLLADTIESSANIDEILRQSRKAQKLPRKGFRPFNGDKSGARHPEPIRLRLGVAFDDAFHFYYPDNLESLESIGFDLVKFSPLKDGKLPENLDALYIGGGYPELFASELAGNTGMLDSIRDFHSRGKPVYAECGGLIYLCEGVETLEGERYHLVGALRSWAKMTKRFMSLGYVEATLTRDSHFGAAKDKLRGHKFHYSTLTNYPDQGAGWETVYSLNRPGKSENTMEGYQRGATLVSYVHLHFASRPGAATNFMKRCKEVMIP